MSIVIPKIEKYVVGAPTITGKAEMPNSLLKTHSAAWNAEIDKRKFEYVTEFDNLKDARKFIEGTDYVIQFVFKEIENEPVH